MKTLYFFIALISFILFSSISFSQSIIKDTTETQPTQYRRGVSLLKGYQTYEQKYAGKNLLDEKNSLYPLGFPIGTGGTNHLDKITTGRGIWTELNPGVPRVDYLGIHFVNTDTGWACGDLGTIIKTTNGGSHWTTLQTNTTTPILKVNSYNGQIVIASGFNGLILRSSDGGETWTQETSGVTGDMWGLQMINDTLGWSCGTNNSLIKTTDGGQTWQIVTTPGYTSDYWWIDFMNENYGFIAANGKVLRTTDGGNNWDIIQAGDAQALYSVDVIDSLHIAAAGYGGTGYSAKNIYSSDGGNTWINGGSTTSHPVNCIKYINPDTGYFVMSEIGLWKTTDRGQHWSGTGSIGEYEIQFFPEDSIGYDAGTGLKIYKTEGNLDVWNKLIINDDFADVFFTSEQKGFVISSGPTGRVYRTTDAGLTWELAPGPSGYSLLFTDSLTGYLGSTSVWKTTNGGDSWYETNSPNTYGEVSKIYFINKQTGWYVAWGGVIFKTTDGGENWFEQLYRSGAGFTSIYFVDSLYGWASLGGTRPYKTIDGGENWIEQTNMTEFYMTNDVYFANHDTGWITNDYTGYVLYRTNDGGTNWDTISGIQSPLKFAFFPNKNHWLIVGYDYFGNYDYETTDGGETFVNFTNDLPAQFGSFSAPSNYTGFAVGGGGLILKYEDTSYTPVELIAFNAEFASDKIILNWETASELNNKGFQIEKSFNKKNWLNIGFVPGKGTTTQPETYSFVNRNVSSGTYKYRLKQIDFNGSFKYSKEIEINVNIPLQYSLNQNYPNPFNPSTEISYQVPKPGNVELKVYDILGREVAALVNGYQNAGKYTVVFSAKGGFAPGGYASRLASGIYLYKLKSGDFISTKKMVLLK